MKEEKPSTADGAGKLPLKRQPDYPMPERLDVSEIVKRNAEKERAERLPMVTYFPSNDG